MHDTLNPKFLGYLDSNTYISSEMYEISGWSFNLEKSISKFIMVDGNNRDEIVIKSIERPDVLESYEAYDSLYSGFVFKFKPNLVGGPREIYAELEDGTREMVFLVETLGKLIGIPKHLSKVRGSEYPDLVVVDNFYDNPDEIRRIAMEQEFEPSGYHKGKRTSTRLILDGTKEALERIIGRRIIDWNQAFNGVFQHCNAQDPIVYHADVQSYAAMVFLTPDAPPESGTTFYRSKNNGLWRSPTEEDLERYGKSFDELWAEMFGDPSNFYDGTRWEKVDVLGNRYNRLVMFNSKLIHAASQYFGDSMDNSRLFHMFFFDCE